MYNIVPIIQQGLYFFCQNPSSNIKNTSFEDDKK